MTFAKTICIITACLCSSFLCTAQSSGEVMQYASLLGDGHKHEKAYTAYARQNKNEIQLLFSALFLGYKTLISSQDGVSCNFTPSCSEYGMLAVKKRGAFIGIMMTFDRLTRCHGFSPNKYKRDDETELLIDHP